LTMQVSNKEVFHDVPPIFITACSAMSHAGYQRKSGCQNEGEAQSQNWRLPCVFEAPRKILPLFSEGKGQRRRRWPGQKMLPKLLLHLVLLCGAFHLALTHLDGKHVDFVLGGVDMGSEGDLVSFMALHCLRIAHGPILVVCVAYEA